MIYSMTGYGKATVELPSKRVIIEVKGLNSKQLDIAAKVPTLYREKEMEMRGLIAQRIKRGKIDFNIYLERHQTDDMANIDIELAAKYYEQIKELNKRLGFHDQILWEGEREALATYETQTVKALLSLPDVVHSEQQELDEDEWKHVRAGVEEAIDHFVDFRRQEGAALDKDLRQRIDLIKSYSLEVPKYETERVEKIKARITSNIEEVVAKDRIDQNRLEQELIYYIEKLDINEEKVRLANHLEYFLSTMDKEDEAGKKLGFIAQEMGREINTLGSKANQAEMQRLVVQMKDELEKIKEQVLNVL
ncbi:MAG: YicC family protein [Bacteroidales bacterium]|nr:YicC family protein [Bacteroidales bacterium]